MPSNHHLTVLICKIREVIPVSLTSRGWNANQMRLKYFENWRAWYKHQEVILWGITWVVRNISSRQYVRKHIAISYFPLPFYWGFWGGLKWKVFTEIETKSNMPENRHSGCQKGIETAGGRWELWTAADVCSKEEMKKKAIFLQVAIAGFQISTILTFKQWSDYCKHGLLYLSWCLRFIAELISILSSGLW